VKHFILFDLDGTLTEPRRQMDDKMKQFLDSLTDSWGILTGSDETLVKEQIGSKFDDWTVFSCNGTKVFNKGKLTHHDDMRRELGAKEFGRLMATLISLHHDSIQHLEHDCLTGNFINNRGGMINFTAIGRGQNDITSRQKFVVVDKNINIRQKWLETLHFEFPNLCINLGGETGIDIAPNGWGKDYVKRHLPEHNIIFFGDRLEKGGNDYDMRKVAKVYSVTGPDDLIQQYSTVKDQWNI
jgi:HAD superfamily hydrolase (TIGR01484 family)